MAAAQQQQLGAHPPVPEAGAGAAESQGEGAWQALPRAIRSGAAVEAVERHNTQVCAAPQGVGSGAHWAGDPLYLRVQRRRRP